MNGGAEVDFDFRAPFAGKEPRSVDRIADQVPNFLLHRSAVLSSEKTEPPLGLLIEAADC